MVLEIAIAAGVIALLFAGYLAWWVLRQDPGNKKMQEIALAIQQGAQAYLLRQYKTLVLFVVILLALVGFFVSWNAAVAFLAGVIASALAGFIGMTVSVRANVRAAQAAGQGLDKALNVAVKGGSVTGMALVGLGLIGVTGIYLLYKDLAVLIGFGFGASLISLFARVGGGIYTKAADVGADLVGKIEKGIPEDDPRNPAVIADNVGDNVGDCAGMAADLFESYTVTIIASMLLGVAFGPDYVTLPLLIGAAGAIASALGIWFVSLGKKKNIMHALYKGVLATSFFAIIGFWFFTQNNMPLFYATLVGVAATMLIGLITEYYTSKEYRPVKEIANAAKTGAGTNLIQGLAVGLE
ncbi:MAG TPA: sodium/proton-translocating pyrophosphatase, partial [Candidatus Norongarragalinales archaeon]|nr:sodium/proton-translocating pyrophosphatase [Candidatus Norongarragalinales archaeon]